MGKDNRSGHGAGAGLAGIGVLALILRICSNAGDLARPLSYADDIADVARYGDDVVDVGRGFGYADDTVDGGHLIPGPQNLLDDASAPPGSQLGDEADEGRYANNPSSSESIQPDPYIFSQLDEFYETEKNLQFMEDYVTNYHQTDEWLPLQTGETINQSVITSTVYDTPATNHRVISIIPTEEASFQNVFGTSFSVSAKREMEKNFRLFKSLSNSHIISSRELGEEALFKLIRQNHDTNPLIIVGHSDEANAERFIVLPNGETARIRDIQKVCLESNTRCLVLTCYSDDFQLTGKISLEEAYYMTQRGVDILNLVQNQRDILPQGILSALEQGVLTESELMVAAMRSERIVRKTTKLTIVGVVSTTTAGGTYIVISHYTPD